MITIQYQSQKIYLAQCVYVCAFLSHVRIHELITEIKTELLHYHTGLHHATPL